VRRMLTALVALALSLAAARCVDLDSIPGSMTTTEQARLLEKASVGQAPGALKR
jgi:hypothetical protein